MNVNGLNISIRKQGWAEWIKKYHPTACCFQVIHFKHNSLGRLGVKGWKNIYHVNTNQKKSGVSILISDKVILEQRKFTRDRKGHRIMIYRSTNQEVIVILNVYAPNNRAEKYVKQKLIELKAEIDKSIIIVRF